MGSGSEVFSRRYSGCAWSTVVVLFDIAVWKGTETRHRAVAVEDYASELGCGYTFILVY